MSNAGECPLGDGWFDLNLCWQCEQYIPCVRNYAEMVRSTEARREQEALLREEQGCYDLTTLEHTLSRETETFLNHYFCLRKEGATIEQAMGGTAYTLLGEGQNP